MCDKRKSCEKSEHLKGKPQESSPKRIKECHGPQRDHPCVPKKKTK